MPITDLLRNWSIAKQYVKESPSLPNILKAFKYLLDVPSNMRQMELRYYNGGVL